MWGKGIISTFLLEKLTLKREKTMKTRNKDQKFQWLPTFLIAWNIFDIAVHVAVDMVEPLRVTGNIVGIAAALIVLLGVAKAYAPHILGGAAVVVVILNTVFASGNGARIPMLIFIGASIFLLLRWAQVKLAEGSAESEDGGGRFYARSWAPAVASIVGVAIVLLSGVIFFVDFVGQTFDGVLEGADYWRDEPLILSAGLGFDNIIGVSEVSEDAAREAGGTWYGSLTCTSGEEPSDSSRTSIVPASGVSISIEGFADYDDGLPVVFSWPIATETLDVTDFQFTLNTGDIVFANSVTMTPNWEHNERNVVVLFGDFGNRGLSSEDDVIFPAKLEIVAPTLTRRPQWTGVQRGGIDLGNGYHPLRCRS
jgi:hypothetical protein